MEGLEGPQVCSVLSMSFAQQYGIRLQFAQRADSVSIRRELFRHKDWVRKDLIVVPAVPLPAD